VNPIGETVTIALDHLEAASELLRDFDAGDVRAMDSKQLSEFAGAAERVSRLLTPIQLGAAAEIADRSRPELGAEGLAQQHGCMRPAAFLERVLRISGAEATRRIRLCAALCGTIAMTGEVLAPRYPALADAVAAGDVGSEAAAVIVRALDDARRVADPNDLDVAEAGLVDHARHQPVQLVTDLAIVVRDYLDPDGVLPREQETRARRGIVLGRERNGIVPIRGGLAPSVAALLRAAFDESNAPGAQPRFLSENDRRDGTLTSVSDDGTETVTVGDIRTREQRQHDVFGGLIKAGIRNTGTEPGQIRSTAEVTAHISFADLEAGTGLGWIDGIHEPVSANTIGQLLCDAKFRRILLGNNGEVLAYGKARYPFNSAQRKAIIARDGDTCVLCDSPAAWADTHHVEEFYTHGALGETNVDNGVMLCEPHHDLIHHSEWQISMIRGIPHVLAPPEIDSSQTWKRLGRRRVRLRKTG
jgi:Domain of unknown function (DUF222)